MDVGGGDAFVVPDMDTSEGAAPAELAGPGPMADIAAILGGGASRPAAQSERLRSWAPRFFDRYTRLMTSAALGGGGGVKRDDVYDMLHPNESLFDGGGADGAAEPPAVPFFISDDSRVASALRTRMREFRSAVGTLADAYDANTSTVAEQRANWKARVGDAMRERRQRVDEAEATLRDRWSDFAADRGPAGRANPDAPLSDRILRYIRSGSRQQLQVIDDPHLDFLGKQVERTDAAVDRLAGRADLTDVERAELNHLIEQRTDMVHELLRAEHLKTSVAPLATDTDTVRDFLAAARRVETERSALEGLEWRLRDLTCGTIRAYERRVEENHRKNVADARQLSTADLRADLQTIGDAMDGHETRLAGGGVAADHPKVISNRHIELAKVRAILGT